MKYIARINSGQISIQKVPDDFIQSAGEDFIVETKLISNRNGNGLCHLEIKKEGNLYDLKFKYWGLKSIVRVPFTWSGYNVYLEIYDSSGEVREVALKSDGISIFKHDGEIGRYIKPVYEKLIEFGEYRSWKQYDLEIRKAELLKELAKVDLEISEILKPVDVFSI